MTRASARVGLGAFFLKARPVRLAGLLVGLAATLLFASLLVQQALTLSGPQVAELMLGNADAVLQDAGGIRIGEDPRADDAALAAATERAGGRRVGVYWNDLGQHPDGAAGTNVNLFENDWGSSRSSSSVELLTGEWPATAAEATVSPTVAQQWPVGSKLTFYGGRLEVVVVGIARARFQHDSSNVYLSSDTLATVRVPAAAASRLGAHPQRFIYWNGDADRSAVQAAVEKSIEQHPIAETSFSPQLFERASLIAFAPSAAVPTLIGSIVAPLLAALIGGIVAARFANRVRFTLWTVGVSWRRTRTATITAILGATTLGAATGVIGGLGLGLLARLVIAPLWTREIGTFTLPIGPVLLFLALQAVGASTAQLALRHRTNQQAKAPSALRRRLTRLTPVIVAAVFVLTGTTLIAIDSSDTVFLTVAAFFYGLVVLALIPAIFSGLGHLRPRSMPLLLALRRITQERRTAALSLVAVTTIVLLGFCTSIFIASSFASFNKSQAELSPVLADELQISPQTGSVREDTSVRRDLEQRLDLTDPAVVRGLAVSPRGRNEAVATIGSAAQFESLARVRLSAVARRTFEGGGALLVSGSRAAQLQLATQTDSTRTVPAVVVGRVPTTVNRYRAFILRSTAKDLALPTENVTYTYSNVTIQQRDRARAVAARAGINPDWVTVYVDPPVAEQSLRTALSGSTLAVLAGLLMLIVAITETRNLRPSLAGLRAVGVGSPWLGRAVTARTLVLTSTALALALGGAGAGVAVMLQLSGHKFLFAPPITALATTCTVLLALALVSSAVSSRRLRLTERALS